MKRITLFILALFYYASIQAQPTIIKIGASLPLSGDLAFVGKDIYQGLLLAKKDFDSEKVKYEIIAEDDGFQGKNAASAGNKLLDIDKVDIILSLWDMAEIIAPMAERKSVPHISIRWSPHVAEKYKYTMTFESTYMTYANAWLDLLKKLNIKSVFILKEEVEGWNLVSDYMIPKLKESGIEVKGEVSYIKNDLDLRTFVIKAIRTKPDRILLFSNPPQVDIAIKRIREMSPKQDFSGSFDEILEHFEFINNVPFITMKLESPDFNQRFEKEYGNKVLSRAAHAYDLLSLIDKIYKEKGIKIKGEDLIAELNKTKDFPGMSGTLNSNGKKTIETGLKVKIYRDGVLKDY